MKSAALPEPCMMTTGMLRIISWAAVISVFSPPSSTSNTTGTWTPAGVREIIQVQQIQKLATRVTCPTET